MALEIGLVVIYGLAAAIIWGAGDFLGAVATKRIAVNQVLIYSQIAGFVLLLGLALVFNETFPETSILMTAILAGIFGGLGLMALYRGLSKGKMSITAPIAAILSTAIPVVYGAIIENLPSIIQLIGILIAILAVLFLSLESEDKENELEEKVDLQFAIMAGVGFGMFFITVDAFSASNVYWSLAAARLSSVFFVIFLTTLPQVDFKFKGSGNRWTKTSVILLIAIGVFDSLANMFFALASKTGRLDVASSISSLYPASTILLAWLIYKQNLDRKQWIGVVFAGISIILLSLQ